MNILLLAEVSAFRVIGGAERMLRYQAQSLHRSGHKVSLIVRSPGENEPARVSVEGVTEYRYPVRSRSAWGFVISSITGSLRLFDNRTKEHQADAVIVHQSLAAVGPIVLRKGRSRRWLYMYHSPVHEEYRIRAQRKTRGIVSRIVHLVQEKLRYLVEHLVVRRCDTVMVLSAFMRERLVAYHRVPHERIRLLPGATDTATFIPAADKAAAKRRVGLDPGTVTLFTLRCLEPRMGLENLVDAIRLLGDEAKNLDCIIGGQGSLYDQLAGRIKDAGLEATISLAGFIPEHDLVAWYQAADLMVLATSELEGFGLVTVEALACGTPVLGTPVGATPEILSQLDSRLLTNSESAAGIADGIRRCLHLIKSDPAEWQLLSQKGVELVRTLYSWECHEKELERLVTGGLGG